MKRIMNNKNGNVKHKTKHLVLRKSRVSSYLSEVVTVLAWTTHNAEGNGDSLKSGHKVMQQTNIINMITNTYDPQQNNRLGTVSQNYFVGGGGA